MVALHQPRAATGRPLSDGGAVVLAGAAVLGCMVARPLPLALGAGAGLLTVAGRRPWMLWFTAALLGSTFGARAEAGLRPAAPSSYRGSVTLVTDPRATFGGVRAVVRVRHKRLELQASGGAAGAVRASLAGERLTVEGRVRPPVDPVPWLRVRHVVGHIDVRSAERLDAGSVPWRQANSVRRLLERGAVTLPRVERSLFAGFVLGDDRDQSPTVTDDFRAAGLTHLLVVSGQNVAFVLALLAPVASRLRLGGRWAVTIGVIAFFAVVTRGEPSVLRASAMAALAVTASTLGRRAPPLRLLSLAVTALVLIDPLLIESVGFQLSVGASLGIVLLAHPIRDALAVPRFLAEATSVTVAAQLGVAPVLISTFGGLPVVSLPANLLAVPVAGLVMMWGLGAGIVAGLVGGQVATALHVPTRLMIGWVAGVARHAASSPLGELAWPGVVASAVGLVLAVMGARVRRRAVTVAGTGIVALALVAPGVVLRISSPPLRVEPAKGVVLWRHDGGTMVEVGGAAPIGPMLEALRRAGVRRLDLVVTSSGGPAAAERVGALRHRWPVRRVVQPSGGSVPGASTAREETELRIGRLQAHVISAGPPLKVEFSTPEELPAGALPP